MSKYCEVMEHLVLTDDMKTRILSNIESKRKEKRRNNIIKITGAFVSIAAIAIIAIMLFVKPITKRTDNPEHPSVATPGGNTGIPEIKDYNSLKEMVEDTGYSISELQYLPFEPVMVEYYVVSGNAIIRYSESEYEFLCYGISHKDGDVSGMEWEYSVEKTEVINGYTVTLKGDDSGVIVALWKDGDCTKYVSYDKGLTESDLKNMIK